MSEASQLARSYVALATHYGWTAGSGGPIMLWGAFITSLAAVEGRRLMLVSAKFKNIRRRAAPGGPGPGVGSIDPGGAYVRTPPPPAAGGIDLSGVA